MKIAVKILTGVFAVMSFSNITFGALLEYNQSAIIDSSFDSNNLIFPGESKFTLLSNSEPADFEFTELPTVKFSEYEQVATESINFEEFGNLIQKEGFNFSMEDIQFIPGTEENIEKQIELGFSEFKKVLPDGRIITAFTGWHGGKLKVYDLNRGEVSIVELSNINEITDAELLPDGSIVTIGGMKLIKWDFEKGEKLIISDPEFWPNDFDPGLSTGNVLKALDDGKVVIGPDGGSPYIKVIDFENETFKRYEIYKPDAWGYPKANTIDVLPDGELLIAAEADAFPEILTRLNLERASASHGYIKGYPVTFRSSKQISQDQIAFGDILNGAIAIFNFEDNSLKIIERAHDRHIYDLELYTGEDGKQYLISVGREAEKRDGEWLEQTLIKAWDLARMQVYELGNYERTRELGLYNGQLISISDYNADNESQALIWNRNIIF